MFLSVKQPAYSKILIELSHTVETILSYSVQRFTKDWDIQELSSKIDPSFQVVLTRAPVQRAVNTLFALPYLQRLEIYQAYSNDGEFEKHIDDNTYQLSTLSNSCNAVLKALCKAVYENAGNLFSPGQLQQHYAVENGKFGHVCPVCVRELLFDLGEGEVDHYFPKSRHPSLFLHPYNLLPICGDCNGLRHKSNKDPISKQDSGPGELQTVFLPYLRPAANEVDFDVDKNCKIMLLPQDGTSPYTQKRIDNLERLYKLGTRWSTVLSHTYDDIVEEISQKIAGHQTTAEQLKILRTLLQSNADSTRNRPDFVKGVYCAWLLKKSDQELSEIFFEPKDYS